MMRNLEKIVERELFQNIAFLENEKMNKKVAIFQYLNLLKVAKILFKVHFCCFSR